MKNIFKPMLFSTTMVQAILEGRKTITRRTKGLEKINLNPDGWEYDGLSIKGNIETGMDQNIYLVFKSKKTNERINIKETLKCDDVIWVREAFTEWPKGDFQFYATTAIGSELGKWKPSIHMPKKACRIFLKVKSIKIERLQEISVEDAKNEGVKDVLSTSDEKILEGIPNWKIPKLFQIHQFGFTALWCKINGCDSWLHNPFVFAIEFERIEKPLDFIV